MKMKDNRSFMDTLADTPLMSLLGFYAESQRLGDAETTEAVEAELKRRQIEGQREISEEKKKLLDS